LSFANLTNYSRRMAFPPSASSTSLSNSKVSPSGKTGKHPGKVLRDGLPIELKPVTEMRLQIGK